MRSRSTSGRRSPAACSASRPAPRDQVFALPQGSVDADTLAVEVEEPGRGYQPWARVDDLAAISADPNVAREARRLRARRRRRQLRFGDGVRGRVPEREMRVRLASGRFGGGRAGNLPPGTLADAVRAAHRRHARHRRSRSRSRSRCRAAPTPRRWPTPSGASRRCCAIATARSPRTTTGAWRCEVPGVDVGRVEVLPRFKPRDRRFDVPRRGQRAWRCPSRAGSRSAVDPNPRPDRPFLERVHAHLAARSPLATELYVIGCEYVPLGVAVAVGAPRRPRHATPCCCRCATRCAGCSGRSPPGGTDGTGWPLGRAVRERELEVEISRVAGVREVDGLNLFTPPTAAATALPPGGSCRATPPTARRRWRCSAGSCPSCCRSSPSMRPAALPTSLAALPNPFAQAPAWRCRWCRSCAEEPPARRSDAMDANGLTFCQLADAAHWRGREHTRWDADCRALGLAERTPLADAPSTPPPSPSPAARSKPCRARSTRYERGGALGRRRQRRSSSHSHLPPTRCCCRWPKTAARSAPSAPTACSTSPCADARAAARPARPLRRRAGRLPGFVPWRLARRRRDGAVSGCSNAPAAASRGSAGRPLPANDAAARRLRARRVPPVARELPPAAHRRCSPTPPGAAARTAGRARRLAARPAWRCSAGASTAPAALQLLAPKRGAATGRCRSAPLRRAAALAGARYAYALAWLDAARASPCACPAAAMRRRSISAVARRAATPTSRARSAAAARRGLSARRDAAEAPFAHRVDGPPRYPTRRDGRRRAAAGAVDRATWRAAARRRTGADIGRRARRATARQRQRRHRLAPAVCRGVDPGRHRLRRLARRDRRCRSRPPSTRSTPGMPHGFGREHRQRSRPRPCWRPGAARRLGARAVRAARAIPGLAPWPARARPPRPVRGADPGQPRSACARSSAATCGCASSCIGDGRAAPEIAALRAWASRFDYVDHYLPRLYRESCSARPPRRPASRSAAGRRRRSAAQSPPRSTRGWRDRAAALRARLRPTLGRLGHAAALTVEVERPGSRWRLVDAAAARVWHLRARPAARSHGVLCGRAPRRPISCRGCWPTSKAC